MDRLEGYAIQAMLANLSGQGIDGWKIAATSRAGQAHIAVDGPLALRKEHQDFSIGEAKCSGFHCRNQVRIGVHRYAVSLLRDPSHQRRFEVLGGAMGEVIEDGTSHWTDADREAVASYLLGVE